MRTWGSAALCLVAGAVLGGCLGKEAAPESGGALTTPAADEAERPLRLEDQRGKVVLLHFWHTA
jgi:hypothetical protein